LEYFTQSCQMSGRRYHGDEGRRAAVRDGLWWWKDWLICANRFFWTVRSKNRLKNVIASSCGPCHPCVAICRQMSLCITFLAMKLYY